MVSKADKRGQQAASPNKERDFRKYELDRSSSAATAANENSRPMAQTAVLINGAAATAVIAFLTREKIDPVMLRFIPWSLLFYAIGVSAGAFAMYFMTECLDYFNCFWEMTARATAKEHIKEQEELGDRYWEYVRRCFFISIGGFVLGSLIFAYAVWHLVPRLQAS